MAMFEPVGCFWKLPPFVPVVLKSRTGLRVPFFFPPRLRVRLIVDVRRPFSEFTDSSECFKRTPDMVTFFYPRELLFQPWESGAATGLMRS